MRDFLKISALATALLAGTAGTAGAQVQSCFEVFPEPRLPPADSPALYRCASIKPHPTDEITIPAETYATKFSSWSVHDVTPGTDRWVAYDEKAIQDDFWKLWRTGFLDNLWIEVIDEPFSNGVIGKHVIFHIEERARVKVIDYEGSKQVDISKIESTLDEKNLRIRTDAFVDQAAVRKVKGVIQELYAERGYHDAKVEPSYTPLPGGPRLVQVTFNIKEGPKYKIREVNFEGNSAYSDGKLRGQMKENKQKTWLSFLLGSGTYQEAKFAEDAQAVENFYKNEGYVQARVGSPQIDTVEDSKNGKTRWIRVNIPVDEGQRYRIGQINVESASVKPEALVQLTKLKTGDYYNRAKVDKAFKTMQELYGSMGFYQWNPEVSFTFPGTDPQGKPLKPDTPPIVDVHLKMQEGPRFTVHRIIFTGNTTTRDNVIRREMRVAEANVFNMKALQESVRRLNQLGYFKPFEGREGELDVIPRPDDTVDIKLKFEEQNRNQLAFGAGVSQFDGFFGQLSFQTSNFLGRGETLGISLQRGSQARQYQVSFSEPYLFDRPITIGTDIHKRQYIFPLQYTQDATGGNLVVGFPVSNYGRTFLGYSYEQIQVYNINPAYLDPRLLASSPSLRQSLLIDQAGKRKVSKISPSYIFNTINVPIFPDRGIRYTGQVDVAGLFGGGNTDYTQFRGEGIWFVPLTRRMSFGLRAEGQYIRPYGRTITLPIFEKLFIGGEYTMRGFDIRTVAPRDPQTGLLTGGNKTMVFNAEYYINIMGPVRALLFYDAGQIQDIGQRFTWYEDITVPVSPDLPLLTDPFQPPFLLTEPGYVSQPANRVIGRGSAFRTSTGAEIRFFMPVLNVPFRLIAAYNPQRRGILNNNLRLTEKFVFRFAVGTTF